MSVAKRLAEDLLSKATSAAPIHRTQLLDANQTRLLSSTLNRPNLYPGVPVMGEGTPKSGTPLPLGYHLIYFTPAIPPSLLGADGTDIAYSPAAPFTRRMWAGGKLIWTKRNPLRIGQEFSERTRLVSAVPKVMRSGEEMIVVGVEKTFENGEGVALVDKRDWVFRPKLLAPPPVQEAPTISAEDADAMLPGLEGGMGKARDFVQTPATLFRFSALTFNAHQIHYSRHWCREVEGHREIVVHGPLNLVNMLDFWRDEQGAGGEAIPSSTTYRATAPFYAGERYRGMLETEGEKSWVKLWGRDGKGSVRVGMMGDIIA